MPQWFAWLFSHDNPTFLLCMSSLDCALSTCAPWQRCILLQSWVNTNQRPVSAFRIITIFASIIARCWNDQKRIANHLSFFSRLRFYILPFVNTASSPCLPHDSALLSLVQISLASSWNVSSSSTSSSPAAAASSVFSGQEEPHDKYENNYTSWKNDFKFKQANGQSHHKINWDEADAGNSGHNCLGTRVSLVLLSPWNRPVCTPSTAVRCTLDLGFWWYKYPVLSS